ncbi:MAG: M16 family metallopeptidase [Fimbriimonadaceae bacterium]
MTSLLAAALFLTSPSAARIELGNGVVVAIEPMRVQGRIAVVMSATGTGESVARKGQRHLLEHLVALGPHGDFDSRIERMGGYLRAETTREAVEIGMDGPSLALETFLNVVTEAAGPFTFSQEQIVREARVIGEEEAIRRPYTIHAAAAWNLAFGDGAPDPMGDAAALASVTPDALATLHAEVFDPRTLVVAITGDFSVEEATKLVYATLGTLPSRRGDAPARFQPGKRKDDLTVSVGARGGSRAAVVSSLENLSTLAKIAAGFAIQRSGGRSLLLFTESFDQAVVTLWSERPDWDSLDADAKATAAPFVEAGIRDLARALSPGSPFARARLEARLGAPTGVRATTYLSSVAARLDPNEVLEAAAWFAEPVAMQVRGR